MSDGKMFLGKDINISQQGMDLKNIKANHTDTSKGNLLKDPLSGTRDGMFSPELTRQIGLPSTIVTPGISFLAGLDNIATFIANFYIVVKTLEKKYERMKSALKPLTNDDSADEYSSSYKLDKVHQDIVKNNF